MNDVKIINDPVFGFIKIPKGLLYNIVEHPLFQRLNRINQLGLASVVYPGARHTRFQHSLGAFHLMSEAILNLQQKGIFIFESEAEAVEEAEYLLELCYREHMSAYKASCFPGVEAVDAHTVRYKAKGLKDLITTFYFIR